MDIAFLLFPGVTQLDFTGPAQFLSRIDGARIHMVAKSMDPIMTDAGFAVLPTTTFDDLDRVDILCVPGGLGVTDVMEDDASLAWLRSVGRDAKWITSVCTGSLILAAAGLLTGYRAGCHWAWLDQLALFGAEPVDERVVTDRNRMTGGGVTAGIDFALTLVAAVEGRQKAELLQLGFFYDPQPPFDCGSPQKAGPERVAMLRSTLPGEEERARRIRAVADRVRAPA